MKKTLLSCMAMFACAGLMVNAEVNEPVLSLSFDQNGLVVGGTDAASESHATRTMGTVMTFQNMLDGKWLGATEQNGVFAIKYNANDGVGQALQGSFTIEFLANVVTNSGRSYAPDESGESATIKIFSTEQSGGWTIAKDRKDGLFFEIGFDKNPDDGKLKNEYYKVCNKFYNPTGRYYQYVAVYDQANHVLKLFCNGQLVASKETAPEQMFVFPNIGDTKRVTGMDLFLGGDTGGSSTHIENGNRTVFVHGNIYPGAMTDDEVAALYNTPEIKSYTEMKTVGHTAMFIDAVFGKDGAVKNNTAFNQTLETAGTMVTQWNAEQMRYETVQDTANNQNFYYCDTYKDLRVTEMLADALSYEVYMKAGTATPAATMSPISMQQGGGFGFEFQKTGLVKFNFNTYGLRTTKGNAGNDGPNCSTPEGTLSTDYDHYVVVANRPGSLYSRIYKNGELLVENVSGNDPSFMGTHLPYTGYQWVAIGGDAKWKADHSSCDYPFQGNISIARAWGKALTEEDVKALYAQATSTSSVVTFNEYGLATVCLPFAAKLPEGVDAYIGYKDYGNAVYTMKVAKGGDVLPYGLPVLLAYGKTGDVTISAADLTVESALEIAEPNQLEGSFVTTQMAAGDAYVLSGNAFVKCEAGTLPANAVWFNADVNDIDSKTLLNVVRPNPVGVKAVESAQKLEKDVYYDLEGRKVSNPGRGIYIKNGVKVFNAR